MNIIDAMKYFQTSLAQIASIVTPEKKVKIKKLTLHNYFGTIWLNFIDRVKKKLLKVKG